MEQGESNVPWFSVNLLLKGANLSIDPEALQEIGFELSMRPHIMNPRVSQFNKEKAEIGVYAETDGLDEDSAGNGMAEELFEIACASLREVEGIHVEVINVKMLKQAVYFKPALVIHGTSPILYIFRTVNVSAPRKIYKKTKSEFVAFYPMQERDQNSRGY